MQSATIYCPRCGAGNDPQMPYCVQCGTTLSVNQAQPGINTIVQNNALIAPPPPPTSYGALPPTVPVASSYQAAPPPYVQPTLSVPQKKRAINPLLIVGILVALVLVIGGIAFAVFRPASGPTYPMLAAAYEGNVHNNTVNKTATFTLTSVVEDAQGNIKGNALVGAPLVGSGPFKGKVGTDRSIQFTVTPNDNSGIPAIQFTGTVHANGSLGGTYTVPYTSETGTWQTK